MTKIHELDLIPKYLAIVRTLEYGNPPTIRRILDNGDIPSLGLDLLSAFKFKETPEGKTFWQNINTNSPNIVQNTFREHYVHQWYLDWVLDDGRIQHSKNKPLVKTFPTLIKIIVYVRQLEQGLPPRKDVPINYGWHHGNFDWKETREGYARWKHYFDTWDSRFIYNAFRSIDVSDEPINDKNKEDMPLNKENAHQVTELSVSGDKMQIKALADLLANYYTFNKEFDFEENWNTNNDRNVLGIFIHRDHATLMMMSDQSSVKFNLPYDWDKIINEIQSYRHNPMEFYKANDHVPKVNEGASIEWGCFEVFYYQLRFLSKLTQHCNIELEFDDQTIDNVMINDLTQMLEEQRNYV